MPKVKPKHPNESFEALLRRFKRVVDNANVIQDVREKEAYEKPTTKRKRKKAAAKKRHQKDLQAQRNKFPPRTKQHH